MMMSIVKFLSKSKSKTIVFFFVIGISNLITTASFAQLETDNENENVCGCNATDLLTRFIEAIANDEVTKKIEFRGPEGPEGREGAIGPHGIQGRPGERGEPGPMGLTGEKGSRGDFGRAGRKGAKGEPSELVIYRQLANQHVIEIKGQKGDQGRRGARGEMGLPGLSLQGEKGEPGRPAEFTEHILERIRGEKGERGSPGRILDCKTCYTHAQKKKNYFQRSENESPQKIYIPVKGPPGAAILGPPGVKGEPGEPGRMTREHVLVLNYEDELIQIFDKHSLGTLAYVRSSETFFIQTERGWKEINLTGRVISPYSKPQRS